MSKNVFIQVYIPTHNRADFLKECVDSVLKQEYDSFQIIISDNSTNNDTEKVFSNLKNPKLIYKRRKACSANEHFNLMIKEATADYFMMFHDDDVMLPNMLKVYSKYIERYKIQKPLAIGANAFLIKETTTTNKKFRRNLKKQILVTNQDDLSELYLRKNTIVPFPGYIYSNKIKEKGVIFNGDLCGKYADVAMLLNIASKGSILNIPEVLMYYRTHNNNDSRINNYDSRSKLIKHIIKITNFTSTHSLILRYRLLNIYNELISQYFRQDPIKLIPLKKLKRMIKLFFYYKRHDFAIKIIILQVFNAIIRLKE